MNRRLGGDVSLNAPIREDGHSGEWQDWFVDEHRRPGDAAGGERGIGQPQEGAR